MAYVFDPEKDKQQQQPMGAGAPPPTPTGTSGSGTQGTSGAAKPTGSGTFTNLQSYIRANDNTDAGKQVGQTVLASPDKALTTSQQEVGKLTSMTPGSGPATMDKADEDFLTGLTAPAVKSPSKPNDTPLPPPGSGPFGNTGGFAGASGAAQAAAGQADKAAQDKARYEEIFTKYGKGPGSYSGPSVQDVADQESKAIAAQTAAGQAANVLQGANTAGRADLLKTEYGKDKQYSGGENKLDSFLLERNFGNQFDPKFQQAKTQLTDQEKAGSAAATDLKAKIGDTSKAYTDTAEKWRKLLADGGTAVGSSAQDAQTAQLNADAIRNSQVAAADAGTQSQRDFETQKAIYEEAARTALANKDYSAVAENLAAWKEYEKQYAKSKNSGTGAS